MGVDNPRAFSVLKVVQGSFHQGNPRFGDNAGKQCMCNALLSICYSAVKNPTYWGTWDLDYILVAGDNLYTNQVRTFDYLNVDELPAAVTLEGERIEVKKLKLEGGVLKDQDKEPFLVSSFLSNKGAQGSGILFIVGGYAFSVIWGRNKMYVFDSHSRDESGLPVHSGTSVLLQFANLSEVQRYIRLVYGTFEDNQRKFEHFQMQFVDIAVATATKKKIMISLNKKKTAQRVHKMRSNRDPTEIEDKKLALNERKRELYRIGKDEINERKRKLHTERKDEINKKKRKLHTERKDKVNKKKRELHIERKDEVNKKKRELHAKRKNLISRLRAERKDTINERQRKHHEKRREAINERKRKLRSDKKDKINEDKRKRHAGMSCVDKENLRKKAVKRFKAQVRNGPFYVCVICNRTLYKRSVLQFDENKYNMDDDEVFQYRVTSYDSNEYICHTCHSKLRKNRIPCQAVSNGLKIENLPEEFSDLRKLEKVIISKRILFKKITIMPKGQSPKIKGAICNVPINAEDICNVLPRGMDNNGVVQVALKKRLRFKSHVYFEAVRPSVVQRVLSYLKSNNPLYADIDINLDNIPDNWINTIQNNDEDEDSEITFVHDDNAMRINNIDGTSNDEVSLANNDVEVSFVSDDQVESTNEIGEVTTGETAAQCEETQIEEEDENPLDELRITSCETAFVPDLSYEIIDNTRMTIAPGEDKAPLPLICDEDCEMLAHPHLFPTGKFGYTYKRDTALSACKYFNQRLLNWTQAFSSDTDFVFFAQAVTQHLNLNRSINTAMQKIVAEGLTAGELSKNYEERIKSFVANDEAFNFMNMLKGTPAYWKRFLFEVLAMVKVLGLPAYFMTLSCADLRWNELVEIIQKLKGCDITEEEIRNMSYFERTEILNSNPVLLARHFQYRVETFFKEIVLSGLIGKVKHYAIRVEFQVRGSPHIHCLIWVEDAPKLESLNEDQFISFVDKTIKCDLPDPSENPELFDLVRTYQVHSHSKSCRKYKNIDCRYSFGKYFTDRTRIAVPLADDFSSEEKKGILNMRKNLLTKVKKYIDENLNPKVVNIHYPDRDHYQEAKSITEILEELNIPEDEYYGCLEISSDDTYQIHFKRSPKSCFVNNYFEAGLTAWEANLDIQPVLDYYKAVSYMCAYLSKSEDESSQAMKQAAAEAYNSGSTVFERMKSVAHAYRTHREMSIQEAVAIVLPEIWLRKTSPAVIFANSNLPEKRYRVCRTQEEVLNMPEDSTNIFKRNMLDRYIDRPNSTYAKGKYAVVDNICYAEFLSNYLIDTKANSDEINDSQPEILDEINSDVDNNQRLPKRLPLMSTKEYVKLRKEKCVLRFHEPNPKVQAEAYAHHLLFMFYPFRNESELNDNPSRTYSEMLARPEVLRLVNENKKSCEPYGTFVDEAFLQFHANARGLDPSGEQENDDVTSELAERPPNDEQDADDEDVFPGASGLVLRPLISDDMLNERIRTLNTEQRKIFEIVIKWAREHLKNLSSARPTVNLPLHVFLTGSAGCGKSHLLITIRYFLMKILSYRAGECDKDKVLVIAPTGVAAVNVDGGTIHSSLGICPDRNFGKCVSKLTDKKKCLLRNKLSEVRVIIIDEISMVSNKMLLYMHQRLIEIFGSSPDNPFAGLSVMTCGDFFQLPPIQERPIYSDFNDAMLNISHPWRYFKIAELTEVMRQRGDQTLIDLLNNVRIGILTKEDEAVLKSRIIDKDDPNYPFDAIHLWAENVPVNEHNKIMLNELPEEDDHELVSVDKVPKDVSESILKNVYQRSQMDTGGLAYKLIVKKNAKVMITSNVDVADKLNNGQLGEVKHFKFDRERNISVIYLKMDDDSAGLKAMNSDPYARQNGYVPIKRIEKEIKLSKRRPSSPSIKRLQFPLALAWACTIHKVQGKTFIKVVVNLELFKQKAFNPGQLYVALSRVTSLDGLFLTGKFDRKYIKVDQRAIKEYERMRKDCQVEAITDECPLDDISLTVSLLNVRSLQKHAVDVANDNIVTNCDILCLTETQLTANWNMNNINETLKAFNVVANNSSSDRFLNIAYCHKTDITVEALDDIPGASLFSVIKPSFSAEPMNILLIYRKNNLRQNESLYMLQYFLERWSVHVVLGDFNINGFQEENFISQYLSRYELVVTAATHISGALLDHIYVLDDISQSFNFKTSVKNVHFTDHDAVKLVFSNK